MKQGLENVRGGSIFRALLVWIVSKANFIHMPLPGIRLDFAETQLLLFHFWPYEVWKTTIKEQPR